MQQCPAITPWRHGYVRDVLELGRDVLERLVEKGDSVAVVSVLEGINHEHEGDRTGRRDVH